MSAPTEVISAMVTRLQELLGDQIKVSAHEGAYEGKDFVTEGSAAVLVTCLDLPIAHDLQSEPPTANGQFAAFCLVDDNNSPTKSRGDVAMDLAGLVASHVQRERWNGTATDIASRVRAQNLHNRSFLEKGIGVWVVRWTQPIELTAPSVDGILERLTRIDTTFSMGTADTPDVAHTLEFTE